MIVALIVTGIVGGLLYYTNLKPFYEETESEGNGDSYFDVDEVEEGYYLTALIGIVIFLIVVFGVTTLLAYIVIERLPKRKK